MPDTAAGVTASRSKKYAKNVEQTEERIGGGGGGGTGDVGRVLSCCYGVGGGGDCGGG